MEITEDIALFNQLQSGDRNTFEQWMNTQAKKIELLAFQYGCNTNQIQQVTKATFRKLHSQIAEVESEKQLCLRMYQIAFDTARNLEQLPDEENRLPFEEDQQLHEKINRLNDEYKIILLLTYFHDMTEKEASFVTGIPEDEVLTIQLMHSES